MDTLTGTPDREMTLHEIRMAAGRVILESGHMARCQRGITALDCPHTDHTLPLRLRNT